MNLLDIGGGFPAPYDASVKPFRELARKINTELDRLFPKDIQILAEPGRFMVATAGTAVAKIIGKAVRDGKQCYYIDDGVYHTFSGVIFDHCHYHLKSFKPGPTEICSIFGPTCDALDVVSMAEELPTNLERGDIPTFMQAIHLVENGDHRFCVDAKIPQHTENRTDLFLELRMTDVYHMQQQIGATGLFQGRAEGRHQLVRQVVDEAYGVRQDHSGPTR
jgi:hypothetical protein